MKPPEPLFAASNQQTVSGSVKLTGSDNGFCQFFGLKNGCDANYVLHAKLYSDESVAGKLTDVGKFDDKNTVLVQADVDCMKFFVISGVKYVVVGGVYIKGDKFVDIFELDAPFVGRRFVTFAKEDVDGVVFYSSVFVTTDTCDEVTEDNVETRIFYEKIDGQAIIEFPSDPVNCGEVEGKKDCRKSKQCEWDTNEETCVSSLGISFPVTPAAQSLSKEEAPIQDMANGSNSADPKMIMSGLVAGLFFALWL